MTPAPSPEAVGRGEAFARAALAGNPSDGYGGAVLALAFGERRATATARRSPARGGGPTVEPDAELVRATIARFAARHAVPGAADTAVSWSTTIPRSVGLGGSSAIVIATLRALAALYGVSIEPPELAALALSIEVDDLGIAAGLQDRIAQAFGALTFMDFAARPHVYAPADPARLPPLLVAWRSGSGGHSGAVHAPLRDRHARGEPSVLDGLRALAGHARAADVALRGGDPVAFAHAVDGSFDARQAMLTLDPCHVAMIECARSGGAAANYTGSGGAIVAVCEDDAHRRHVADALRGLTCETLAVAAGADPAG
jgi:glucuronokinase